MTPAPTAILCDLLTALVDSWTLWNACAGSASAGRRWRAEYLRLTYGAGDYVPYEALVQQSAVASGLTVTEAEALTRRWDEIEPWRDVGLTLSRLPRAMPIGVVTNCSRALGRQAAAVVERAMGRPLDVIITAEEAGAYKPDARPYRAALTALGRAPEEVLFVAGSPSDLGGATAVGMPVVWHNAVGLARPAEQPVPLVASDTLSGALHGVGIGDGVTLRDAAGMALDPLVALSRETFRETYLPNHSATQVDSYLDAHLSVDAWEQLRADRSLSTTVLVAPDGALLGYYLWRAATPPDGTTPVGQRPFEVVRIYVRSGAQGRGLGAALIEDARTRTRRAGGDQLWLSVAQYNTRGIAFYERMGLSRSGTTLFDFSGTLEPDFVMACAC